MGEAELAAALSPLSVLCHVPSGHTGTSPGETLAPAPPPASGGIFNRACAHGNETCGGCRGRGAQDTPAGARLGAEAAGREGPLPAHAGSKPRPSRREPARLSPPPGAQSNQRLASP